MIDLTPYANYTGLALDKLGADRDMPRLFGECDGSYRCRLIAKLVRDIQRSLHKSEP